MAQMMSAARNLLFHHAFAAPPVKMSQLEYNKPLVAPAGLDSFAGIGNPPSIQVALPTGIHPPPLPHLGLYTILPLQILYGAWHTQGDRVGSRISRVGRAMILQ